MRHNPRPQEMYRHFKGGLYQIRCLAKHTETGEMLVVYQAMYGSFEIFARPLSLFMDEVDRVKYPSAGQKYRFELLEDMAVTPETSLKEKEDSTAPETVLKEQEKPVMPAAFSGEVKEATVPGTSLAEEQQAEEQLNIDPLVLEFLDANSYGQRLMILDSLHNRITDDMINMMAVSADLEIKDGDLEDRYMELRNCLRTFERYECNRLR